MEGGTDRFRFLEIVKRSPISAFLADPITFIIMFNTMCTAPFVCYVFLKLW